jgi:hypothetical protein
MPNTTQGRKLLAHELTHVIQQDKSIHSNEQISDSGPIPHMVQRATSDMPIHIPPELLPHLFLSPSPEFICGPDVTKQVKYAVSITKTKFGFWTPNEKTEACNALTSLREGTRSWDIVQLHGVTDTKDGWLSTYEGGPYSKCASMGADPKCHASVQVGTDCHYAGSANYVIFGTMCKLCFDHFSSIENHESPISFDVTDFTESEMLELINKYKGTGSPGLPPRAPVPDFIPSQDWAKAGYRGWPSSAAPAGDRSNCSPSCATPYSGTGFVVHWHHKDIL